MLKRTKLRVLGDLSSRELELIQLRVRGMKVREIGEHLQETYPAIQDALMGVYKKAGVHNRAGLRAWAFENALDDPTPLDTPETKAVVEPKKRYQRIRLGRIRRSRLR